MHVLFSIVATLSFMVMLVFALLSILRDLMKVVTTSRYQREYCETPADARDQRGEAVDDAR
jgi:hypothetical protein